jgi:hypothetical protein
VQGRGVDQRAVQDDIAVVGQALQGLEEQLALDAELVGVDGELLRRSAGVAVVHGLEEEVERACGDAPRVFIADAHGAADAIRGEEPDAGDLLGEAVGVLPQDLGGVPAEALPHLAGQGGAHAQGLHEGLGLDLGQARAEGLLDALGASFTDARHLLQALGVVGDHVQGGGAKAVHDAPGERRADVRDEARPEEPADPVGRGGELRHHGLGPELLPMGAVLLPGARDPHGLPRVHGPQRAHHRELLAVHGEEAHHGEALVIVAVGHRADQAPHRHHPGGRRLRHELSLRGFTHGPSVTPKRRPKQSPR